MTKLAERLPDMFSAEEWRALSARLRLSPRQAQVARLICRGQKNHELAEAIGIKLDTIRMHRRELFKKLKIDDRVGVPVRLILAWRHGK